jgi:hypothetical protein
MKKDVAVTVTPNVGITISPSGPIKVKKHQHTIEWKATQNDQKFGIVLPPGEPPVTCGPQGAKWVCTAGPFDTGSVMRVVKYDVTAPNAPVLDPDIEIFPDV